MFEPRPEISIPSRQIFSELDKQLPLEILDRHRNSLRQMNALVLPTMLQSLSCRFSLDGKYRLNKDAANCHIVGDL